MSGLLLNENCWMRVDGAILGLHALELCWDIQRSNRINRIQEPVRERHRTEEMGTPYRG
jgi:hypothetical protein